MTSITGTQDQPGCSATPLPPALRIMGVDVTPLASYEQALDCIGHAVAGGAKSFWAAVNPQKMYRAWREPAVLDVLRKASAGICDGIGVTIAARFLCGVRLPRVTGCDLFYHILPRAQARGWSVFLLGASGQASSLAAQNLQRQYPALRIVGRQDGFFKDDESVVRRQVGDRPGVVTVDAVGG